MGVGISIKRVRDVITTRSRASHISQMNSVESSVTRLLVSTKHLLESLTQWARREADDKFVSDAYVKLGNDFRAAAKSFTNAGVDISDLGDVPKALRIVLESALSEAPTQENLDRFLPNIRNIIVTLLLGLKQKQQLAKNLTTSSDDMHLRQKSFDDPGSFRAVDLTKAPREMEEHRKTPELLPPVPRADSTRTLSTPLSASRESNDALARLQLGNVILRRASKRFSAYQFAKLVNYSGSQPSGTKAVPENSSPKPNSKNHLGAPPTPRLDERDDVIFLRIGEVTKRVQCQLPISMAAIRLLFVEKFAYTPENGEFPEIYIMDAHYGVSYELEESNVTTEVRGGAILILQNAKVSSASTDQIPELISSVENKLDAFLVDISSKLENLAVSLSFHSLTAEADKSSRPETKVSSLYKLAHSVVSELTQLKHSHVQTSMTLKAALMELQAKVTKFKGLCFDESSSRLNRTFMEQSYAKLSEDSDSLLTKVDDLQDTMEALRKDVAQRGVRLGLKQLRGTQADINEAKKLLSILQAFIQDGKPTWKRIWEAELDKVCEEQQFFNLQDDLTRDLDEDIKKIEETFVLIEKCSVEQSKHTAKKGVFITPMALPTSGEGFLGVRDALINEVSGLVPDHEGRLDAIVRAEQTRARMKKFHDIDQFQEELGEFVDEGKLRKSGGIEEVEKMRQARDLENIKSFLGVV